MARPYEEDTPNPGPRDPARENGAAEVTRLRDDIDRGGTGDKVAFSDPSAAPLGTDAEAGGVTPRAAAAREARAEETGRATNGAKPAPADRAPDPQRKMPGGWMVWAGLLLAVLVLIWIF
jgi:hypothetical protein